MNIHDAGAENRREDSGDNYAEGIRALAPVFHERFGTVELVWIPVFMFALVLGNGEWALVRIAIKTRRNRTRRSRHRRWRARRTILRRREDLPQSQG